MAGVNDIGIDLGSSHVLIYMKGKGIILREASVVAIDRDSREIIAFGEEASRMIGRTPGNILALRPLRDGSITDYELVSFMLKGFVMKAVGKHMFARPRAILAVPSAVNEMERRSLISTMFDAGMRRTQLLNRSLAAALGLPAASVVVGAGCVDVHVVADVKHAFVDAVYKLGFVGVVDRHFRPNGIACLRIIEKFACKYLFEELGDARAFDDLFQPR